MPFDLTSFRQAFIEESLEGLAGMEDGLLQLDGGDTDPELINTIFRAAHSIKGGCGSFDLNEIAGLTHVMETLLDAFRDGRLRPERDTANLLLSAVDCLRDMLCAAQAGEPLDQAVADDIRRQLETRLTDPVEPDPPAAEGNAGPGISTGWRMRFTPEEQLMRAGNDPLLLFRALGELGSLAVAADTSKLPHFKEFNPELAYLAWDLTLLAEIPEHLVRREFEWVEHECELRLLPINMPESTGRGWRIQFSPFAHLMRTGNDPMRMFRELAELGDLTATAHTDGLKDFGQLEPEDCLIAWTLNLVGDISRESVAAVFDWVEGDAELVFEPIGWESVQTESVTGRGSSGGEADRSAPMVGRPAEKCGDAPRVKSTTINGSIRVDIGKVDALINLVGELVITQSMLNELSAGEAFNDHAAQRMKDGIAELERNTRDLQESVMGIRMMPISFAFNRFPRMVRDLCVKVGKRIELKMSGGQTELDKTVMEKISDPLTHLVRNAVDHGIEPVEARRAAGKSEVGAVLLNAYQHGGSIVIEVGDDGAGLNRDKLLQKALERGVIKPGQEVADGDINDLVFAPGFSTAEQVTDISGRGVGMDVVRKNIQALGGSIEIETEFGKGTMFRVVLPLTLAILDGQSISVGGEVYIVPLTSIMESIQVRRSEIRKVGGKLEVFRLRDEYLPLIRLHDWFGVGDAEMALERGLTVVVEGAGKRIGLLVDELLNQQQVVIKSLETNFKQVSGFSGATILGDGSVALILDIAGLVNQNTKRSALLRVVA